MPARGLGAEFIGKDLRLNTLVSVVAFAASSSFLVGLPLHEMSLRIGIQYSLLLASLPVAVWVFSRLRRRRA